MTTKQTQYRFRNGVTPLSERELNSRFFDVDGRLGALEALQTDWVAALAALDAQSLARVAELLARINDEAAAALASQAATFATDEAARDATLAGALATALAELQSDQAAYEALAAALNNIIANSEGSGADILALQVWRDTLDPNRDGALLPDRLRSGNAAITYDTGGQITHIDITLPGDVVYRQAYTYATDGAITQIVATLGLVTLWTRTYTYDGAGALTGWTEA